MDTKILRYFMKVASLHSVSKAAEQLFITQPALSRYIARLEKEIGVPLFIRQGKRMALT